MSRAARPELTTAVDAGGFWVADTAGDPRRSVRLLYPALGDEWDRDGGQLRGHPLRERSRDGTQSLVDSMLTTHIYGGYDYGNALRFDLSYPFTAYGRHCGGFVASGDARLGVMWLCPRRADVRRRRAGARLDSYRLDESLRRVSRRLGEQSLRWPKGSTASDTP